MKFLVWKAYGDCKVYEVSSDNFETIKSLVLDCIEYYGEDVRSSLIACTTVEQLVDWVADNTEDDDHFEYFGIAEMIECK